jgi:hypothetical protein
MVRYSLSLSVSYSRMKLQLYLIQLLKKSPTGSAPRCSKEYNNGIGAGLPRRGSCQGLETD